MDDQRGFTLIEILVFIIVSSILLSTLMLATTTALKRAPDVQQQRVAMLSARQCLEWFLMQRRINGYASLACPSSPTASVCTAPSGYSVSASVSCTTWNSDTGYKTITVAVSGSASTSLSVQIGNY